MYLPFIIVEDDERSEESKTMSEAYISPFYLFTKAIIPILCLIIERKTVKCSTIIPNLPHFMCIFTHFIPILPSYLPHYLAILTQLFHYLPIIYPII